MKIAVGVDHGGFAFKKEIIVLLEENGYEVVDVGCNSADSVDYPDFAGKVVAEIEAGHCEHGILLCGTGIGMSIAANRSRHIRAALCHDPFTARMSREHNDANVLCMGARVIDLETALQLVGIWLETAFAGGRHLRRVEKMGGSLERDCQ